MEPSQRHQMASISLGHHEQPYKNRLIAQLDSLSKWHQMGKLQKKEAIWDFMDAIGNLYMDYFHTHLDEAKACGSSYQELLKKEFLPIVRLYGRGLMFRLENADELEEPWDIACRGRTNIEAFNAIFGELIDTMPTEQLVDYMERKRGRASLDRDEIPKNALPSHWWWFNDYQA